MEPIYWLMLFVVLLGIEILTMGLTTIWFAGGALAAFLISLIGCPVWLQAVVFIAVSLILLLVTRPFAIREACRSGGGDRQPGSKGKRAGAGSHLDSEKRG